MYIFWKILIKNIKEKKLRTSLIVFSVAMATALCFASISISDTMTKTFTDKVRKDFGQTEIVIKANSSSLSEYINLDSVKALDENFTDRIGVIEDIALYKPTKDEALMFHLQGIELDDLQKLNPVKFETESDLYPFEGRKIIISSSRAEKYNIKVGQKIKIQFAENWFEVKVVGTASVGVFDGQLDLAVLPRSFMSSVVTNKNSVSKIYIKLKDPSRKNEIIEKLSEIVKDYDVKDTISKETLEERVGMFQSVLILMLLIIILLSIFIIFISFKVISTERLPMLGTLRSVGADRKLTSIILLGESILYGVIGGVLGCFLGIGILYLMAIITSDGNSVSIVFKTEQFPIAFCAAIILTIISSIIPIIKIARTPVKNIIFNNLEFVNKKYNKLNLVFGVVFIIASFLIPNYSPDNIMFIMNMLCIILIVISIILVIPILTAAFTKVFEILYRFVFGNIGIIASKNLRENRHILNNITLLAIGISTILMISTAGKSTILGIVDFTKDTFLYDVEFSVPKMDRSDEKKIKTIDGVFDAAGVYEVIDVPVYGSNENIILLEGAKESNYLKFKKINLINDSSDEEIIKNLDLGRNIIITTMLSKRYGAEVGDTITLLLNNKYRDYKVIALMDTMNVKGSYAVISEKYFKRDVGDSYYSRINIKTNKDPSEVLKNLRTSFALRNPSGITVEEDRNDKINETKEILTMMDGVSVLAMFLGIFAVINNLTISFMQRKRSLAVFRSLGLSKFQAVKMIFIEAITVGLVGGLIGAAGAAAMIRLVPYLTKALIATIPVKSTLSSFVIATLSGVVITVVSSISSAIKTSKIDIIKSIKYE